MAITTPIVSDGGGSMGAAAAEFQRRTEEAFQAQMVVSMANVTHSGKSAVANATGQLGSQVGQDIRAAARPS